MIILSITILFEVILLFLLLKLNKTKKNIGQKISFLYNKLYQLLILSYYYNKKDSLKDEVLDFYSKIVLKKNILEKEKEGKNFKEFIINYFEGNINIYNIIDDINWNIEKQYNILNKSLYNIVYSMIIVIILGISIDYILI